MYKKVLIPISGQNHCARAAISLERARKVCDGEFVLLHVTEPVPQIVGGDAREELKRQKESQGLLIMAPIIERLQAAGLPFHTRVVGGTVAETISQIADEEKADLIVMFTDGRDGIQDMIYGSVTERVLRRLGVDLLAVHGEIKKD